MSIFTKQIIVKISDYIMKHWGIINCGRSHPSERLGGGYWTLFEGAVGAYKYFYSSRTLYIFPISKQLNPNLYYFFHTIPGKTWPEQEVMCFWLPVDCGNMAVFALNKWTETGGGRIEASYICALLESLAGSTSAAPPMRGRGGKGGRREEDRWPQSGDGGSETGLQ